MAPRRAVRTNRMNSVGNPVPETGELKRKKEGVAQKRVALSTCCFVTCTCNDLCEARKGWVVKPSNWDAQGPALRLPL